jgi:Protein of unknown function (DUF2937)
MGIIRGILDRIILLAAIMLAACIPSYIVQYRQRLGGRLDQVHADLAPFQAIADRNFGGSLQKLIEHHMASPDSTFHQEGVAIQSMVDAIARFQDALQALNTDLVHQCLYLAGHSDYDLARSTWNVYQPGFTLTLQGAVFAAILGLIVWLLFLGIWHGIAALFGMNGRRPRYPDKPRRPEKRGPEQHRRRDPFLE